MESISPQRRRELLTSTRHLLKLELRDNYASDAATFQVWRDSGAEAARGTLRAYAEQVRAQVASGRVSRRVKVISEPPSEYMRHAYDVAGLLVDAGQDIRWLPRTATSDLFLPGNDMFVLDGHAVMFNVFDGADEWTVTQYDDGPEFVAQCVEAFEAAWKRSVPHREYRLD